MPTVAEIWDRIRHRPTVPRTFVEIAAARVLTPLSGPSPILPERHYFGLVVDELFLANSGQWTKKYDPMVVAITEFTHAGQTITLPFVVGPKLLGQVPGEAAEIPEGMLYRGTRVAGVHPFRGGRIVSTIILCQLQRRDHARQLLKVVESVAGAVPFGTEVGTYTRFAGSLLDGIDSLLGLEETVPLAGVRQEFDHDLGTPIRNAYYVLIDAAETTFPLSQLWVRDGTLQVGPTREHLHPLREASYALFSIRGAATISDLTKLPQQATVGSVIALSAGSDKRDWERAKAELLVLYRQLLTSPDLTRQQALAWYEDIEGQAVEAHHRQVAIQTLGPEELAAQDDLRDAVKILDLE